MSKHELVHAILHNDTISARHINRSRHRLAPNTSCGFYSGFKGLRDPDLSARTGLFSTFFTATTSTMAREGTADLSNVRTTAKMRGAHKGGDKHSSLRPQLRQQNSVHCACSPRQMSPREFRQAMHRQSPAALMCKYSKDKA